MIGADAVEAAGVDRVPERGGVGLLAQRRAHDPERAGARVLGPVGLGFGPRPYHRPVVLVDVGEATQPLTQLTVPVVRGADRCERLREARHLLGHVGRERAEQVFLVGEVQVEGAV